MKEKKIVRWVERKVPSELEECLFPNTDWSLHDKYREGEVIDTVMGIWDTFYVIYCTDGKIRRVNVKEVKDG